MNREEALRALVEEWETDAETLQASDSSTEVDDAIAEAAFDCAAELRAILDASPWIPVMERLPEVERLVPVRIVLGSNDTIQSHAALCEVGEEYYEYEWLSEGWAVEGTVTHWYDVPNFPEES